MDKSEGPSLRKYSETLRGIHFWEDLLHTVASSTGDEAVAQHIVNAARPLIINLELEALHAGYNVGYIDAPVNKFLAGGAIIGLLAGFIIGMLLAAKKITC